KLADKVAAAGFYVVAPDFFYGEPYDPNNPDRPLSVWIKDHGPDKGYEDAKLVIDALKNKGVSSIGAAGFCWGGKYHFITRWLMLGLLITAAKVVAGLAKDPLIQAAVMLHPSFVTVDDIKSVKVPIAILGAEHDHMSPPELLKQFDEILKASEVDSFVKIFPKVAHGWSVRYDVNDLAAVSSANEGHQDMLEWFAKYLK
ncbi:hypothetical protein Goari_023236, partial [Gossypium aridum]|nr:hypothetical protein [Gossypium aridum]